MFETVLSETVFQRREIRIPVGENMSGTNDFAYFARKSYGPRGPKINESSPPAGTGTKIEFPNIRPVSDSLPSEQLLSAFYDRRLPSENLSGNVVPTENPLQAPSKNPSKSHLLLKTLLRSVRQRGSLYGPIPV